MSEHEHERLRDINEKMLVALWKVQLDARIVGTHFVIQSEVMRAVGTAIVKAEGANDERA